jgi:aryl-alcohol dehydrogenase-like predicted oxidoreductase
VIDLYYLHRVDEQVPLEDTWGAMSTLVRAGKVRSLGLSEVSVNDLGQGEHVIPIPGTKRVKYLEENVGAAAVHLTPGDLTELELLPEAFGSRY